MQSIPLPDDQYEKLTRLANAEGYEDISAFLSALTANPAKSIDGSLSEEELASSLKMIRESEADIAAGRVQNMRQSLRQIAQKHGLSVE